MAAVECLPHIRKTGALILSANINGFNKPDLMAYAYNLAFGVLRQEDFNEFDATWRVPSQSRLQNKTLSQNRQTPVRVHLVEGLPAFVRPGVQSVEPHKSGMAVNAFNLIVLFMEAEGGRSEVQGHL